MAKLPVLLSVTVVVVHVSRGDACIMIKTDDDARKYLMCRHVMCSMHRVWKRPRVRFVIGLATSVPVVNISILLVLFIFGVTLNSYYIHM